MIEVALPGKLDGFFVEAGARDGVTDSNTLTLEQYFGWDGICVEPNRADFVRLRESRACRCANVCLYDRAGTVRFAEQPGVGGIVDHIRHRSEIEGAPVVELEAVTLEQLLDRFDAPRVVDYLSLDTEGSERSILERFPFDRYAFRCVSIEGYECNDLLEAAGYERVANPFITDFHWEQYFIRPDLV